MTSELIERMAKAIDPNSFDPVFVRYDRDMRLSASGIGTKLDVIAKAGSQGSTRADRKD
jgi:hypothetical protein